jgi:hypothetical protein
MPIPNGLLAEQLWREEFQRLGGDFPELEALTDAELKTLIRVRRAKPETVGRRLVVTWEGRGVWFRTMKDGIRWYVVTREQDDALCGDEA